MPSMPIVSLTPYVEAVGTLEMPDLLAGMVASGGPRRMDARNHRHLHAALVWLGQQTSRCVNLPTLDGRPDPEAGLRVEGVTRALWRLVGQGFFSVHEWPGGAAFVACEEALAQAAQKLAVVPPREQLAIRRAATLWANKLAASERCGPSDRRDRVEALALAR